MHTASAAGSFKWGARAGVFGFPAIQLAFDPVERVAATGALMAIIGALFGAALLGRRQRTDRRGLPSANP
jgi:acyl phosphate:glycerol-3-phosphate acyltransferase